MGMGMGDGDWGWALGIWGGVGDMHGASGMGILMGIRGWGWALGMGSGNGEWGELRNPCRTKKFGEDRRMRREWGEFWGWIGEPPPP